ncbi:MAG TPA: tRNA 2-thiouridine(34) synthase MnmA [Acidimicrobiales bacterium]|nr:tRNA 2-thiouridine(34) synthase MnmA [Acidimicrobiales bacterium]
MQVLVAMSGGVDSSVAAALLTDAGHDVVGATLKLWGGPSDSGCCSVADVEDARRVAQQLGLDHHVFNLTEEFESSVVAPYTVAHAEGATPNPCIECNRHIKFDRLLERARRLGFDAVATGHHARVVAEAAEGVDTTRYRLLRGIDAQKDQSYVLSMLGQAQLAGVLLPVGHLTKREVRRLATDRQLRTAAKPDSQDVCFIHGAVGRRGFLGQRLDLHAGKVVDAVTDDVVGEVEAVELVTVGQRRGMGHGSDGRRRYVVAVDVPGRRVMVAPPEVAASDRVFLRPGSLTWVGEPLASGSQAFAQVSAHGRPVGCTYESEAGDPTVRFDRAERLVAPGQTVALYDAGRPDAVLGAGIAAAPRRIDPLP